MKRTLLAFTAAGALSLLAIAAPALSTVPYEPDVVELEIPAPAEGLARSADADGFISKAVEPPTRFNLVGFEWDGGEAPAIAIRVHDADKGWMPWTPVPAEPDGGPDPGSGESTRPGGISAPVWAGEADALQYRFSERPPDLRIHLINAAGTATASDRITSTIREAANGAIATVADLVAPARGQTTTETTPTTVVDPDPLPEDDPDRDRDRDRDRERDRDRDRGGGGGGGGGEPKIVPRKKWDPKNDCKPRRKPKKARVKAAFVHHTVNANNYDKKDSPDMVLSICRFHRNSNGWDDIGYNFVVDRFGTLFQGRGEKPKRIAVGAHTMGFNEESFAVSNLGTFSNQKQDKKALKAQAKLIKWVFKRRGIDPDGKAKLESAGGSGNRFSNGDKAKLKTISGHRDANSTDCPGDKLYGQLGKIRKYAG